MLFTGVLGSNLEIYSISVGHNSRHNNDDDANGDDNVGYKQHRKISL
jgi:hypothetical protein